jgi:hypothetical protein
VLAGYAIAQYAQLYTNNFSFPLPRITFGFDLRAYYDGARIWLAGGNPYAVRGITTPPLSLILVMPFTLMNFDAASYVNAAVATIALTSALVLAIGAARERTSWNQSWPLFLLLALGYPFAFLVSRGNVEYWVWLLIAAGLFLESRGKSPLLSGVCFGLGALLKLYPLIFVAPLLVLRRYKTAIVFVAVFVIGLSLPYTRASFTQGLAERMARRMDLHQNASLTGLLNYAFDQLGIHSVQKAQAAAFTIYAVVLGSCVLFDWLRSKSVTPTGREVAVSLALYTPFISAIPRVAYCYVLLGLVLALPALDAAWEQGSMARAARKGVALFAAGVGLSYAPVYSASYILQSELVHVFPPLGNCLCMIAAFMIKRPGKRAAS